jgi:hypothetical protein
MKKATTNRQKTKSGSKDIPGGDSPSQLIDAIINEVDPDPWTEIEAD